MFSCWGGSIATAGGSSNPRRRARAAKVHPDLGAFMLGIPDHDGSVRAKADHMRGAARAKVDHMRGLPVLLGLGGAETRGSLHQALRLIQGPRRPGSRHVCDGIVVGRVTRSGLGGVSVTRSG